MTSLAAHLLAEAQSGTGDVTVTTWEGEVKEKTVWHGCVLSRSEYFRAGLAHDFLEKGSKEFSFDDVTTRHMKHILASLYLDALPQHDVGLFMPEDIVAVALLARRLTVPTHILTSVEAAFESSCRSTQQSCEKWLNLLAFCTSNDLPTAYTCAARGALKRDALTDAESNAEQCLDFFQKCTAGVLPELVSEDLLEMLGRKVQLGNNLLSSLASAYERDLPRAADPCLNKIDSTADDALLNELTVLGASCLAFDINSILDKVPIAKALWKAFERLDDNVDCQIPVPKPVKAILNKDILKNSCFGHYGTTYGVQMPAPINVFLEEDMETLVRKVRRRRDVVAKILASIVVAVGSSPVNQGSEEDKVSKGKKRKGEP